MATCQLLFVTIRSRADPRHARGRLHRANFPRQALHGLLSCSSIYTDTQIHRHRISLNLCSWHRYDKKHAASLCVVAIPVRTQLTVAATGSALKCDCTMPCAMRLRPGQRNSLSVRCRFDRQRGRNLDKATYLGRCVINSTFIASIRNTAMCLSSVNEKIVDRL